MPRGRTKTRAPNRPIDWYASASAAPLIAVAMQFTGIQLKFLFHTSVKRASLVSAMTSAVMTEPERKYTAAENATATIVGTIAPGGTSPPTSRYVVAAAKVAMLSWPKLNRTLRAGLGVGVTAFTPTTTRFAHR